jgi:hypothetical protein
LTISPRAFALDTRRAGRTTPRTAGATVTYTDTQSAISSFSVLIRGSGVTLRGRCVVGSPAHTKRRAHRCSTYIRIGGFSHADRAGRNSFRFPSLSGHKLTPGNYLLQVTPVANGRSGRTASAEFTILG